MSVHRQFLSVAGHACDLLRPPRIGIIKLDRQVRQTGNTERIGQNSALHRSEILQHRRIDNRFRVLQIRGNDVYVCELHVGVGEDDLRVWIGRPVDGQPVEGVVEGGGGGGAVEEGLRPGPEVALRVGGEIETRHDAEVVAAAAEGEVEVGVGGGVADVADGTVGEDDLVGLD